MSQQNVKTVQGLLAAFRDSDFEASVPYTHPAIELRPALVGGPEGVVYRGLEGARRFWTEFHIEPTEFRDLGERVLVLGHVRASGRGSGITLTSPAAWLAEIRDGQVHRWQSFASHEEGIEAAGLRE